MADHDQAHPAESKTFAAVRYHEFGGPEVLHIEGDTEPQPRNGQLLIDVAASSINAMDSRVRLGKLPFLALTGFPMGIGYDYAGVVREAPGGPADDPLAPGTRVWGCITTPLRKNQAMASALVTGRLVVTRVPRNLSLVDAAALPVAGMTAIKSLNVLGFKRGQRLLVIGGNGGVGTAAISVARYFSDHVDAVVGKNADAALQAGARETFSYHEVDPAHIPGQYDAVLGATEINNLGAYRHLVAPGGTIATIAPTHPPTLINALVSPGPRISIVTALPSKRRLDLLTRIVEAGALTPVIGEAYPVTEVQRAFTDAEEGSAFGKRVVVLNSHLD